MPEFFDELKRRNVVRVGVAYLAARLGQWERAAGEFGALMDDAGIFGYAWALTNPELAPMRRMEIFKNKLVEHGFVAFWRAHGWPDNCRPAGEGDFDCA